VSSCSLEEVSSLARDPGPEGRVIAIANVHSVMSARRNPDLAATLRQAEVVTPDGMPLLWAMKVTGTDPVDRVTGIDVMRTTIRDGLADGVSHFFYGSTRAVLDGLVCRLQAEFPGIRIAGAISPPFRRLTHLEMSQHVRQIRESGADIVWVGLGMPKQELWMHDVHDAIPGTSLIGVGAAFEWVAGNKSRAPRWMQNAGLEWLYRLAQEPKRLWKRYAVNNPHFMMLLAALWLRTRSHGRTQT
jgi:N-acetylglucosaminyldiphosphoundecaprenol N-acetyl-beta-D-mannosaminyltransferase